MDLWQLSIFCKVVEHKSFSKAAEAVHLSQPTVSSHVKDLEEHFGCRLLDRMGRSIEPTRCGELLYDYARRLLLLRDEAESAISAFTGRPGGKLCVGASTIPGSFILPELIGRFCGIYPEVKVRLTIGDSRDIIDAILEGDVEMGVVGAAFADQRIAQEELFRDCLCVLVPAGHALAAGEEAPLSRVVAEPLLLREEGSGTRKAFEDMARGAGLDPADFRIAAEMGGNEALREAVRAGLGVCVVSELFASCNPGPGLRALRISGVDTERRFYLTRHCQRTPSPVCASFMDFLRAEAPRRACPATT